ncbi:MAG: response regulator SirA [Gemmatimonadetes bacterium GWC2_71_10]|nr:MAG: response regulator SirA [Gemmatimonadetes bacterium GWC2_71_10]
MTAPAPDRVLDCKGLLCPIPIVKLSKTIKELQVGQVLRMVATDPGSMPDVAAWGRQTGHEVLSASEESKVFTFLVRKAK